jgi:hypothetical protein
MRSRKHKAICQSAEALEIREVKTAAITAALSSSGVLTITGTESNDHVHVYSDKSGVVVYRMQFVNSTNGGAPVETPAGVIPITVAGKTQMGLLRSQVKSITMDMNRGDDRVTLKSDIPATVYGSYGNDVLTAGSGAASLFGGSDNDLLFGGPGNDFLYGGKGNDYIAGGTGNDTLFGESGNDRLFGQDGIDWLYGGEDDDYLNGGNGIDHISGGNGVDTFARSLFLPGNGLLLSGQDPEQGSEPAEVAGAFLTETTVSDSYADIEQHGSPTCAFLATLSSVARTTGESDDLVKRIQYDAARNLYGITFCTRAAVEVTLLGKSMTILSAEHKTVWVNGDWTEGRDPGGKVWVTLYQKAYLQLLGATTRDSSGTALPSGSWKSAPGKDWSIIANAYLALTGKVASFVNSAEAKAQKMFDQFAASSRGMVANSLDSGTTAGVVGNHCYSVYKIFKDVKGNWMVRLRNPWACDGSDGAMYDHNSEKQQFADDGLITLTWSQFTANFRGYTKA